MFFKSSLRDLNKLYLLDFECSYLKLNQELYQDLNQNFQYDMLFFCIAFKDPQFILM
jgi:hypothetical protein